MESQYHKQNQISSALPERVESDSEVPALQAINATLEGRTEKLKNPFDPASLAGTPGSLLG